MDVGDHGAERKLPFEPKPQVDQDRKDREHQSEHAVGQEFSRNARSHDLDAAVIDGIAKRAANLLHCLLLRRVTAGLFRHPDQHFVRSAELLQLDVAETECGEGGAHGRDIGRPRLGPYFQEGAALEVDTEVQPVGKKQRDRDDRKRR